MKKILNQTKKIVSILLFILVLSPITVIGHTIDNEKTIDIAEETDENTSGEMIALLIGKISNVNRWGGWNHFTRFHIDKALVIVIFGDVRPRIQVVIDEDWVILESPIIGFVGNHLICGIANVY